MMIDYLRRQNIFDNYGGGMGMDAYQQQPSGYYEDPIIRQPSYEPPPSMPNLPFGGQINPRQMGQEPIQLGSAPSAPNDYFKRLWEMVNQTYTPETVDRDRLRGLLDSFPQREAPGFGRTLAASMVGVGDPARGGGLAGAESVMYAPYMRDVQAWKEKVGPFGAAAGQENTANINERTLAGNMATNILGQERLEKQAETSRRNVDEQQATIRARDANNARIAQGKLEIERAVRLGGVKEVVDSGANIVLVMNDGKVVDTGVATTNFSPVERENLRALHAIQLKQAIPGVNPLSIKPQDPNSPKEIADTRQNTFQALMQTDPIAAKWIRQNDDGSYGMKPRPVPSPGSLFSPRGVPQSDLDEWLATAKKVFPEMFQNQPVTPGGGGQIPSGPPQQAPGQIPGQQSVIPPRGTAPVGAAPPPSTQSNVTGIQQPNTMTPTTGKQPTPEQLEGIKNGTLLRVVHPANPNETGVIPNTYRSIEEAKKLGWNIEVGR